MARNNYVLKAEIIRLYTPTYFLSRSQNDNSFSVKLNRDMLAINIIITSVVKQTWDPTDQRATHLCSDSIRT